jgi:SET domain-containing protein
LIINGAPRITFQSGQFIIEYLGEVLPYSTFLKRTQEYSKKNHKHFYFMSLQGDEVMTLIILIENELILDKVIDATERGNIGRFMNHSCNPNCILQKWIVGEEMRIGIFTIRPVSAQEELTFDYKFERYGYGYHLLHHSNF